MPKNLKIEFQLLNDCYAIRKKFTIIFEPTVEIQWAPAAIPLNLDKDALWVIRNIPQNINVPDLRKCKEPYTKTERIGDLSTYRFSDTSQNYTNNLPQNERR